jgi:hypothetical protein
MEGENLRHNEIWKDDFDANLRIDLADVPRRNKKAGIESGPHKSQYKNLMLNDNPPAISVITSNDLIKIASGWDIIRGPLEVLSADAEGSIAQGCKSSAKHIIN